jgi:hypothetical protein
MTEQQAIEILTIGAPCTMGQDAYKLATEKYQIIFGFNSMAELYKYKTALGVILGKCVPSFIEQQNKLNG